MEFGFPRPKLLALAVCAAFGSISFNASAVPEILVTSEYSLGGGPVTTDSEGPGTNVDYYLWQDTAGGNSVFFHTYGYESGGFASFGARSSGEGIFSAMSKVSYSTLVEISGGPKSVKFDFSIADTELAFYNAALGQSGAARLQLVISTGSGSGPLSVLTSEDISLDLDATTGSITCAETGAGVLASFINCGSSPLPGSANRISASSSDFSVDLGIMSSDFTLQYDIIATVSGSMAGGGNCSYGGEFVEDGYGYGGVEFANNPEDVFVQVAFVDEEEPGPVVGCNPGQAIARSGDPNGFSFDDPFQKTLFDPQNNISPFSISQTPVGNNVPEPSTIALAGLALAGLAVARRRKPD
jgi:hypothetical protein